MTGIDEVERARLENAITRLENQLLFRGESLGTVASALVRALHETSSVIQQLKKRPPHEAKIFSPCLRLDPLFRNQEHS